MFLVAAVLAMAAPVPKPGPDWVTVKGTVVWPEKKPVPEPEVIDVSGLRGGDGDYIRKGPAVIEEWCAVDEKTRGLKDVVVWLRPDDNDSKTVFPADKIHPELVKPKAKTHTVSNEYCRFDRRTLAVRAGDSVEWVNKGPVVLAVQVQLGDDSAIHNLLPGKDSVTTELKKAGSGLFCDAIHNFKEPTWTPGRGRIRVFDHPYFALTDAEGRFDLPNVPRGKWRIVYLHTTGFHMGKDGWLGFPVEVEGNKQGEMTMKPVEFEGPKK